MVQNKLESEISEARRTISSDGYPMSIGELTNLYRNGELVIRPEFQRLFRWSNTQKTRLVESILLGIPLPSIFVAQTEGGKWELVDGLQRVSTILQLQGELIDENGKKLKPLVLEGTSYLPDLDDRVWESKDETKSFTEAQRLDIKRSKIDIKIIKRESSPQAKYDLFHRLNSYGSPLTPQELRSSLVVAASPDFFSKLEEFASYDSFVECVSLSERLIEERFDLELVSRFLVLHNWPASKLTTTALRDLPQVLDEAIIQIAGSGKKTKDNLEKVFKETFDAIAKFGGEEIFRRWDAKKKEHVGSFLVSAFEIFGLGVGYHVATGTKFRTDLLTVTKALWQRPDMQKGFATGRSTEARLLQFIPLGREITTL
jgi:hypothetical protein